MNIVVTGANGFVGRALVRRLLASPAVAQLTLVDLNFEGLGLHDARLRLVAGSLADPDLIDAALQGEIDAVYHLASIPGGAAERDYALGRTINLDATLALLERLRGNAKPPRFVFASSVAVYGENLPAVVDEATLPAPALSYGTHKLIGEYLVADATRLGWVQGCSLRLPGVVARPPGVSGLLSAFMSNLFWQLQAGEPIELPVSREAVAWWISVGRCAENLMHAATVEPARLNTRRSYSMPVLSLTMNEVVDALARRFGADRHALVSYRPDARIEGLFGAYPPLHCPGAEALGFANDGSVDALIEHAMSP